MKKITRTVDIEFRSAEDNEKSRTVAGLAAVFNKETQVGWYIEKVAPTAFDDADLSDVVLNFNHDMNILLAGTRNGSMELTVDGEGLHPTATIIDTTQGNDILKLLRAGLINKMSYAFTVAEDEWDEIDGVDHRTITKIDKVYDCSLVVFPAYNDTYVGLRSAGEDDELVKEHLRRKEQDKRMEELLSGKDFVKCNGD